MADPRATPAAVAIESAIGRVLEVATDLARAAIARTPIELGLMVHSRLVPAVGDLWQEPVCDTLAALRREWAAAPRDPNAPFTPKLYSAGYEAGRRDERAAIVAYLRARRDGYRSNDLTELAWALDREAICIEHGEHVTGKVG